MCDLCEVVGHATNNCLELPKLKPLVHEAFPKSNILEVHVDILVPLRKLKMLYTNHSYALCDLHGHYSHCFPCLNDFHDWLGFIREYEATHSRSSTPLPMDFGTTSQPEHGNSDPSIMIPSLDVEMMDTTCPILYLSSSLSSSPANLPKVVACISIKPFSIESEVSTSVDPLSTSSSSTILDDVYVNLIPQVDAPGNATASCIQNSSRRPFS